MQTPTPRAGLKALIAAILNTPKPYVIWKGEVEPSGIKPQTSSIAVTDATNAEPIVLTVASTALLASGHVVDVSGVVGNTAANGTHTITVIDATHVSLDDTIGNGAYVSGGALAMHDPFQWALVRVGASSREMVGSDNIRRADNGDGTYTASLDGRRKIILSVDLFSYDPTSEVMADDLLELLRTRIWRPDMLARLNALGCVYETTGPVIQLPTSVNGREISAAHVDITIALAYRETSADPFGNKSIGEVTGTGTVTTEAGGTENLTYDVTGG